VGQVSDQAGLGDDCSRPARPARLRAHTDARRHSTRVRFFKRAIPLAAGGAGVLILVATFFNPFRSEEGLALGPLSVSGSKVTMESPRLTGYRSKDSRPYEVTASAATQDVRKPTVVELKDLRARIVTDEAGGAARLEAAAGVFDTQKEQLELRENVRITSDAGHDATLRSAAIDFKAGTVVSREPVSVRLTNGLVEADGMEITDGGKVMVFTGRVRTTFAGSERAVPSPEPGVPARTSSAEPVSSRP
jgi:lipopolysaccharide export system protein LptC